MKKMFLVLLFFTFAGLLTFGIIKREFLEVLRNAIVICYSCIGIG